MGEEKRPAAAPAATDAESGTDPGTDPGDVAADLRALEAMRSRGLIDPETYAARRRALLGAAKPTAGPAGRPSG